MGSISKPATVLLALLLITSSGMAQEPAAPPLVERVKVAIDRGIQFLRDQERGTGNWEAIDKASAAMRGGWSSLAMLALLNAGVRPDDPIIERGLKFLRGVEPEQTYVVALQTMVFAEAGRNEDRERIQRNVDWLIRTMLRDGTGCLGWTYGPSFGRIPDNSNTQYALLGLHAGHLAGARIERSVWKDIQDYYVRTQQKDQGWWYYNAATDRDPRLTMTTAGVCGLLISGMELNAGREQIRPDGTATNCGVYEVNHPVADGLDWIAAHFRIDQSINTFYNLYGIERTGRLSGLRFLGEHDWYREGCLYLTRAGAQKDDGSWHERTHRDNWAVISTSFALLFLSKGRTPVLVTKFVHAPGDDWNNDRNDARHLVEYASKEVFRRLPLAWQIFDTRRVETRNDQAITNLVGDLLQSPILYFNGHKAPRFSGDQQKILKQYVEQGGFILAEACCGRKEFDEGFRALMKELFPENELKKLPPEHPLWRAHAVIPPDSFPLEGMDYGCKTVVVYCPKDLSCLWEANQSASGQGQLAFRLAGNIVAYATGLEPPRPRLTASDVVQDDPEGKQIPRGYLKVAQLRHEGDWQPAPNAMKNLMDQLRKKAHLDVALQTKPIYASDPDLLDFRFLYMHGRGPFLFTDEAVRQLRLNLETGGTLFADACCGKKPFDAAFRELVKRLFPESKLELIPPSDDLYSKELNGRPITTVRCRTEVPATGQAGEYRSVPPALEGIRLGNRWVVIYSKYDIGCALEKHQSTDCLGHDHDSALVLGTAAVLYALKR